MEKNVNIDEPLEVAKVGWHVVYLVHEIYGCDSLKLHITFGNEVSIFTGGTQHLPQSKI